MRKSAPIETLAILGSLLALIGCGEKPLLDFTVGSKLLPGEGRAFCITSHMEETFELVEVMIYASYGLPTEEPMPPRRHPPGRSGSLEDLPINRGGGLFWMDFMNVEPEVEYCKSYADRLPMTRMASVKDGTTHGLLNLLKIYKACVSIPSDDGYNSRCAAGKLSVTSARLGER